MPDTPLALIAKYRARLDKQSQADIDRLIQAYGLMSSRIKDKADLLLLESERKPDVNIKQTARYKEFIKVLNDEFQKYFTYLETELEGIEARARAQSKTDSIAVIAAALRDK